MTPIKTIAQRIAEWEIRMTVAPADRNPRIPPTDEWARSASHWLITFRVERRSMTTYFSQGAAHTSIPTAAAVLSCLALDSAGAQDPYKAWCDGLGYDPDSMKAHHTYIACKRTATRLEKFLGKERFEALIFSTETE